MKWWHQKKWKKILFASIRSKCQLSTLTRELKRWENHRLHTLNQVLPKKSNFVNNENKIKKITPIMPTPETPEERRRRKDRENLEGKVVCIWMLCIHSSEHILLLQGLRANFQLFYKESKDNSCHETSTYEDEKHNTVPHSLWASNWPWARTKIQQPEVVSSSTDRAGGRGCVLRNKRLCLVGPSAGEQTPPPTRPSKEPCPAPPPQRPWPPRASLQHSFV